MPPLYTLDTIDANRAADEFWGKEYLLCKPCANVEGMDYDEDTEMTSCKCDECGEKSDCYIF